MICPNCGQEIIDTKEFCINCGTRLIKEKKAPKRLIIYGMIAMIIVGSLICYFIVNYNTDKEIEPYINKDKVIKSNN